MSNPHAAHLSEILIGLDPVAFRDGLLDLEREASGEIAEQVLQAEADHRGGDGGGRNDAGEIYAFPCQQGDEDGGVTGADGQVHQDPGRAEPLQDHKENQDDAQVQADDLLEGEDRFEDPGRRGGEARRQPQQRRDGGQQQGETDAPPLGGSEPPHERRAAKQPEQGPT